MVVKVKLKQIIEVSKTLETNGWRKLNRSRAKRNWTLVKFTTYILNKEKWSLNQLDYTTELKIRDYFFKTNYLLSTVYVIVVRMVIKWQP
jgi:hypothetical protein